MSVPAGRKRHGLRAGFACLAVLLLLAAAAAVYAGGYSRATREADAAMARADAQAGRYAFGSAAADTGLILYPGGKVAYTAYAPLAEAVAQSAGILCAVPEMPLNLAVFGQNTADAVMAAYPAVKTWYVGGHSLGGAMAASYAAAHPERVSGVVLLAAYAAKPLTVPVLSIYGGNDTVLNRERYEACRANLPEAFTETVIPGGNHANFGCYGEQKGDTAATLPMEGQQYATASAITDWLNTLRAQEDAA